MIPHWALNNWAVFFLLDPSARPCSLLSAILAVCTSSAPLVMILHCRTLRSHRQQNGHCVPRNFWGSSKLRCYRLLSCAQADSFIMCGSSPAVPRATASSLGSPVQSQTHGGKDHLFLRPLAAIFGTLLQDRDGRDHLWLFQITVQCLKCIQAWAKLTRLSSTTCIRGGGGDDDWRMFPTAFLGCQ